MLTLRVVRQRGGIFNSATCQQHRYGQSTADVIEFPRGETDCASQHAAISCYVIGSSRRHIWGFHSVGSLCAGERGCIIVSEHERGMVQVEVRMSQVMTGEMPSSLFQNTLVAAFQSDRGRFHGIGLELLSSLRLATIKHRLSPELAFSVWAASRES